MNIEDVKIGMKVVITKDFAYFKAGDVYTVESIYRDNYIWTNEETYIHPMRVRPATPEDVAPKLCAKYSPILNEEVLSSLEQVIMGEHKEALKFSDTGYLASAFVWEETAQGYSFWREVDGVKYNKQEEPEVTKFDFTNTKINIKKYADENGITIEQAIKDCGTVVGLSSGFRDIPNYANYLYIWYEAEGGAGFGVSGADKFFNESTFKEITLTRNVTIMPSFVTPDTVSLPGGRTVLKKDYDEALSKLKTLSGN